MNEVSWRRKGWVFAAAAGCFGFAFFWQGLKEPEPFKLAVGTRMGSEALVFALSQVEAFPPDRLRMVEMFGATALSRALENEVVDGAILSLDEALQMNDAGHPLRIALLLEKSIGADVLLGGGSVTKVEMLKGKRVGVELRSSGHYLLAKALTSVGLTLADVQLIPITARETPGALLSNEVDALVVTEPDVRRVESVEFNRLFDSAQLKYPIMRVLAVREAVWESHESVLRELVNLFFATQSKMNVEDELFLSFLERRTRLGRDAMTTCLKFSTFLGPAEMLDWMQSGKLEAVLKAKAEDMVQSGLLRAGPSNLPSWDVSFFKL